MPKILKNMKIYVLAILMLAIIGLIVWYMLHLRENFENNNIAESEYPKFVKPFQIKKGYFMFKQKQYVIKFAKTNINNSEQQWVMVMDNGDISVYNMANAATGKFINKVQSKNIIYLDGNNIKNNLGSKFVLGTKLDGFIGLKRDNVKGKNLIYVDIPIDDDET